MTQVRGIVMATAVLSVAVPAGWTSTAGQLPQGRPVREQIFRALQPVALKNCTLKRYGSENDGGYLMCENLVEGVTSAYSYGIASEDNWGCDVSKQLSVPIHQYDCFTADRPTCPGGAFVFHAECVGPKKETRDGRPFDTMSNQIRKNGDRDKRLLVKIDVEGAEWESLRATPDSVLERIPQIPMEFHGTDNPRFLDTIRKLTKLFYVVNLHYNNNACSDEFGPLRSIAYQVLLVNKRIGVLDVSVPPPVPYSRLNAPDNPTLPECLPRGR